MLSSTKAARDRYTAVNREITGWIIKYNSDLYHTEGMYSNEIIDFKIESSAPKGKFFGFAAPQTLTANLLGYHWEYGAPITPQIFTFAEDSMAVFPFFYVDTVEIADTKKSSKLVAYDGLLTYAAKKKLSDVSITYPITLYDYADTLVHSFGYTLDANFDDSVNFTIEEGQINTDGTESVLDMLNAIAEVTGTICFCSGTTGIKFKKLQLLHDDTVEKSAYFNFSSKYSVVHLTGVASTTPLGENYLAGDNTGYVQTIVDNPLLTLRDDVAERIDAIFALVDDLQYTSYALEYRGSPYHEIGDTLKVLISSPFKPEGYIRVPLCNLTLEYNGGLRAKASWEAGEQEEVHTNPTNLGEALKHTSAIVDKVNNEVNIVASTASENTQAISALKLNTESISASVTNLREATEGAMETVNSDLNTLTKKVEATMTAEDVQLQIKSELSNGVDKVTTATGFTFNEDGLTVSKTGSEMTTTIDEDGMSVYRDNVEVLTADNQGVIAYNLHAKTYLIIGNNSRFEDYTNTSGEARTGCFWIGG